MNLEQFLSESPFPIGYVDEPGFSILYVRKSARYILLPNGDQPFVKNLLQLARIEASNPGSGAFTSLIERYRSERPIFVESVLKERFCKKLESLGFIRVNYQEFDTADYFWDPMPQKRSEALAWSGRHWACGDARDWIKHHDIQTMDEAWGKCDRGDWMLWALSEANLPKKTKLHLRRFLCDVVEEALGVRGCIDPVLLSRAISSIRRGRTFSDALHNDLSTIDVSLDDGYGIMQDLEDLADTSSSYFFDAVAIVGDILHNFLSREDLTKLSDRIRQNFKPKGASS